MKSYRVVWEIDLDADSPQEAAAQALAIQKDTYPGTLADHFSVWDEDGNRTEVDAGRDAEGKVIWEGQVTP